LIPWDAIPRTGRGTASRTATGYTVTIAGFGNSWSRRSAQAFVESCEACGKPIKDGAVSRRRFGKHDLPADQVFALDGGSQTDEKRPEASACWGDACQCTAVSEHRPSFGCSQPCSVFSDRSWITCKPLSMLSIQFSTSWQNPGLKNSFASIRSEHLNATNPYPLLKVSIRPNPIPIRLEIRCAISAVRRLY
jgi:hypothetical protein